jgi:hypothetical protein
MTEKQFQLLLAIAWDVFLALIDVARWVTNTLETMHGKHFR